MKEFRLELLHQLISLFQGWPPHLRKSKSEKHHRRVKDIAGYLLWVTSVFFVTLWFELLRSHPGDTENTEVAQSLTPNLETDFDPAFSHRSGSPKTILEITLGKNVICASKEQH